MKLLFKIVLFSLTLYSCSGESSDSKNIVDNVKKEPVTLEKIDGYVQRIDFLQETNQLKKLDYGETKDWGGYLTGYYWQDELVLIDLVDDDLNLFQRKFYVNRNDFYKVQYREHEFTSGETLPLRKIDKDTLHVVYLGSNNETYKIIGNIAIEAKTDSIVLKRIMKGGNYFKETLEKIADK
jgi:hypothetical protein